MTKNFTARQDDLIVVIMGPTGSGKSNFINTLTGNAEQRKAGNLKSDTQAVTPHIIPYGDKRLVLVDTPGFDDTYRPDTEILRIIAEWLTQRYSGAGGRILEITGIIFLHRITDNRMSGSVYKNLQMFGRLCGSGPLPRVRLVTTMWDKVRESVVANGRERQLREDFWRQLIDEGAVALRFDNTHNSALAIVEGILGTEDGEKESLLQEELVKLQKRLNETEAAKVLYSRFQHLLIEQKKALKELADEAKLQNDPELARSLQEEYQKINTQLQKTFEEMNEMRIPLSRRILLWFFGRKSRAHAIKMDDMASW